jgi:hypothetical protein
MRNVSEKCLHKLPPGKLERFQKLKDQFGVDRDVILWRHEHGVSAFDHETGEYIGEIHS